VDDQLEPLNVACGDVAIADGAGGGDPKVGVAAGGVAALHEPKISNVVSNAAADLKLVRLFNDGQAYTPRRSIPRPVFGRG
jgi:hypothetical protein